MRIHNPTSSSRLCIMLGENLEPFEVREVPDGRLPGFVKCEGCQCVVSADPKPAKGAASAKADK